MRSRAIHLLDDIQYFVAHREDTNLNSYSNGWFTDVVLPMSRAFDTYRSGDKEEARRMCDAIRQSDWRLACVMWIDRRIANAKATQEVRNK